MGAVLSKHSGGVAAVQRGQIVQRVLVDGWSTGKAADIFGIPERRIGRWVADYRRRGMASLRDDDSGKQVVRRWLRSLTAGVWRYYTAMRRGFGLIEPAPCIRLRYTEEKPHHGRADLA